MFSGENWPINIPIELRPPRPFDLRPAYDPVEDPQVCLFSHSDRIRMEWELWDHECARVIDEWEPKTIPKRGVATDETD